MSNFKRLLAYAKPHKWEFLGILILGIFASSFQPGIVLGVKPFIEKILAGKDPVFMKSVPLLVMGFVIFCAVTRYVYMVWMEYLSERIVKKVRTDLYNVYTSLSLDHYSQASTGKMMSVMSIDIQLLLEGFSKISALVREPFTILGLLGIAFYRDWKLTLFSLVLLPPLVYCVALIGKKLRKMTNRRQEQWATLNSTVHETLTGIRIVKAFNLENKLQRKFETDNNHLLATMFKWIKIEKLSAPIIAIVGGLGLAVFAKYGGSNLSNIGVSGGDMLSVALAFGLIIDPVKKINALNISFQKALGASDRVFTFMDQTATIIDAKDAERLNPIQKEIHFDNVSFKYETDWVLRNVNLTIRKSSSVAFVGSSGVGKTTLVNLLPRFYDVSSGRITIDGIDVRGVTLTSLRSQISMVSQDVFLFNDTVAANIGYGRMGASREKIVEAAQAANAHAFIKNLAEGYDTVIGERGVKLSGGQRQRLSIARALLKDAPILVLDEATSALDTESETLVQKAIEGLMKGRTSFIIAHRLSTILHADQIAAMEKGRIVELGKHEELMKKQGVYARFYQLQFSEQFDKRGESCLSI